MSKLLQSLILVILTAGALACTAKQNKSQEMLHQEALQRAIENKPSPAEARIIGSRIDTAFANVAAMDQQYVKQVTEIGWGDVYAPDALNNVEKLPQLIETNRRAGEMADATFEERSRIFAKLLSDLKGKSNKSDFAEAMYREVLHRYEQEETGLAALTAEMQGATREKIALIEDKLKLFQSIPGKYEVRSDHQVAFMEHPSVKENVGEYERVILRHNELTSRQRKLAEMYMRNQAAIVQRFQELQ